MLLPLRLNLQAADVLVNLMGVAASPSIGVVSVTIEGQLVQPPPGAGIGRWFIERRKKALEKVQPVAVAVVATPPRPTVFLLALTPPIYSSVSAPQIHTSFAIKIAASGAPSVGATAVAIEAE